VPELSEIFSSSKRDEGALSSSGREGDLGGVGNSDFMGETSLNLYHLGSLEHRMGDRRAAKS
jgi:hypothetical protein